MGESVVTVTLAKGKVTFRQRGKNGEICSECWGKGQQSFCSACHGKAIYDMTLTDGRVVKGKCGHCRVTGKERCDRCGGIGRCKDIVHELILPKDCGLISFGVGFMYKAKVTILV